MKKGALRTPSWYLYLVLAYAIVGLVYSICFLNWGISSPWTVFVEIAWTVFNFFILCNFIKYRERISIVLPLYYVLFYLFGFFVFPKTFSFLGLEIIAIVSSCFELLFAVYLLIRK